MHVLSRELWEFGHFFGEQLRDPVEREWRWGEKKKKKGMEVPKHNLLLFLLHFR